MSAAVVDDIKASAVYCVHTTQIHTAQILKVVYRLSFRVMPMGLCGAPAQLARFNV